MFNFISFYQFHYIYIGKTQQKLSKLRKFQFVKYILLLTSPERICTNKACFPTFLLIIIGQLKINTWSIVMHIHLKYKSTAWKELQCFTQSLTLMIMRQSSNDKNRHEMRNKSSKLLLYFLQSQSYIEWIYGWGTEYTSKFIFKVLACKRLKVTSHLKYSVVSCLANTSKVTHRDFDVNLPSLT